MATTQTGPRLRVEGSCEGCCHLRTGNVVLTCSHPQIRKGPTGVAIVSMKAKHETWDMRGNMRHDCPELPAARLALDLLPPTFTARFAEALYASDDGKGSGALHALLAEVGGTPYDPENDPRYNGAGTATKKGGKR